MLSLDTKYTTWYAVATYTKENESTIDTKSVPPDWYSVWYRRFDNCMEYIRQNHVESVHNDQYIVLSHEYGVASFQQMDSNDRRIRYRHAANHLRNVRVLQDLQT